MELALREQSLGQSSSCLSPVLPSPHPALSSSSQHSGAALKSRCCWWSVEQCLWYQSVWKKTKSSIIAPYESGTTNLCIFQNIMHESDLNKEIDPSPFGRSFDDVSTEKQLSPNPPFFQRLDVEEVFRKGNKHNRPVRQSTPVSDAAHIPRRYRPGLNIMIISKITLI